MKLYKRLIVSAVGLLALALVVVACSGETPTPLIVVVTATAESATVPTEPVVPVLEIVGHSETKTLTMEDLKALPVTEGFAGIKSSTGKITPPIPFKGIALNDLA